MATNDFTYHVKITGMTCSSCVNIIKDFLKSEYKSDIKKVDIDLVSGEAWIVGKKKGLGPKIIHSIEEIGFGASMNTAPDREAFAYYFEVKDTSKKTAQNKKRKDRSDTLKLRWMRDKVTEVNVNFSSNRARIVVSKKIDPAEFINIAKLGQFKAKLLPAKNQKTIYFSIRGLTSNKDAITISDILDLKKEYIISHNVSYSTGTVSINTRVPEDPEKLAIFLERAKYDIETALPNRKITCDLIETPKTPGFNKDEPNQYFRKALINAFLGTALFLLSGFIPLPLTFMGQFVGFLIGGATLGVMWKTGKEFYIQAWRSLVNRCSSDMNTLIALGTGSAWLYSMLLVIFPLSFPLIALQYQFMAVVMILGIINFGKGIRAIGYLTAQKNIQNVARVFTELQPPVAKKLKIKYSQNLFQNEIGDRYFKTVNYRHVRKGDIIKVEPHQRIPVDGVIVHGDTFVNQETLTGEAKECKKKIGDDVFSGSLNTREKTIYVRASCKGSEGRLTKIIEEVARAPSKSTSISKTVDRFAKFIAPATLLFALLSMAGWYFLGPVPALPWMMNAFLSVGVVICPCIWGVAGPIPTTLGVNEGEKRGILFKKPKAIELIGKVKRWMVDKTGTLTEPQFRKKEMLISEQHRNKGWNENNILEYVVSLENAFLKEIGDHPIARMYVKGSEKSRLDCREVRKCDQGIVGNVNNKRVVIGSMSYLESRRISVPKSYKAREEVNAKKGMTTNYVAIGENNRVPKCICVIGLKHEIRKDAKKMVTDLQARGATVVMLTGDKREPALEIAKKLGIKTVFAEKNEKQKERHIKALRESGQIVGMIGDGLNDSLALKAAHVGIAAGPWTHAAPSADITMQKLNLGEMCIIADETMKNIRQNLLWAAGYNLVSLMAASGVLYHWFGILLTPSWAALMMAFSSIFVVFNSSRLIYEIDSALKMFYGKMDRPKTFFQKVKQFFSFNSFWRTLKMMASYYSENAEDSIRIAPKRRTITGGSEKPNERSLSGSPRRQQIRDRTYLPSSPNGSPSKKMFGTRARPIRIDGDDIEVGVRRRLIFT